ncbi:MAG TPA: ArsA-related P-loop ATPase [Acidimicrobiia bacterium]|nr:ArsA-related P-loop ATPase [Acidimicrobiia bacterium]
MTRGTRALVVTGAGGVGKTTISAALAVAAARAGKRTLVLTVDPARRLTTALGIEISNEPEPHPDEPNLWAAMLDATASWQEVVRRHADPEVAERLIDNEFFAAATSHFPASQSYAAAEEAATYLDARAWDLVIVDTPPAAGGIDFFTAPAKMADLVGGRLLRWLTGARLPGRRFLFNRTAKPMLRLADQVLGSNLLERIAEFFMDLRTTYDGVSKRARQIERHMRSATTLVVTTADPAPLREVVRFFHALPEVASTPTAVLFNRSLPESWIDAKAGRGADPALAANLERWGVEAMNQRTARRELGERHRIAIATVPWQRRPPTDLDSLAELIEMAGALPRLW